MTDEKGNVIRVNIKIKPDPGTVSDKNGNFMITAAVGVAFSLAGYYPRSAPWKNAETGCKLHWSGVERSSGTAALGINAKALQLYRYSGAEQPGIADQLDVLSGKGGRPEPVPPSGPPVPIEIISVGK